MTQKIIILDFGSQTTQLIGRRVRELDTFCEIMPYNKFPKDDPSVIGVILSGSPFSVHDPEAFKVDLSQFVGKIPVLGICYGAQFISHTLGGKVEKADSLFHILWVVRWKKQIPGSMVVPICRRSTRIIRSSKALNSILKCG